MARTYKMRRFQNGRNSAGDPFYNYSLTVPTGTAEQLPQDIQYACELLPEFTLPDHPDIPENLRGRTMRGILFEPVDERPKAVDLPDWAKPRENGAGAEKPKQRRRARPGAKAET